VARRSTDSSTKGTPDSSPRSRERGSYDLLAFHPLSGAVLVVEVKTEIASAEATLRKVDEKARLAAKIARARFDWKVSSVSRVLVLPPLMTARRHVRRHSDLFAEALPLGTVAFKQWLKAPSGPTGAVWFVTNSDGRNSS
jgi:hypothetical protein